MVTTKTVDKHITITAVGRILRASTRVHSLPRYCRTHTDTMAASRTTCRTILNTAWSLLYMHPVEEKQAYSFRRSARETTTLETVLHRPTTRTATSLVITAPFASQNWPRKEQQPTRSIWLRTRSYDTPARQRAGSCALRFVDLVVSGLSTHSGWD